MAAKKRGGGAQAKAKKNSKKAERQRRELQLQQQQQQQQQQSDQEMEMEPAAPADEEEQQNEPESLSLLSEELRAELGGADGDVLVIAGSKKDRKKNADADERVTEEELLAVQKMSRSKRKKLEQLAARKIKEARREQLYKSLEATQLSSSELDLMVTSSKLGHKETLRERLKRSMNRQKAGLALTDEEKAELFQQSTVRDGGSEGEDEAMPDAAPPSDSEAESDGETNKEAPKRKKSKKHKATADAGAGATAAPAAVPAKRTSEAEAAAEAEEKGKKKRRKRTKVVTSIVPMLATKDEPKQVQEQQQQEQQQQRAPSTAEAKTTTEMTTATTTEEPSTQGPSESTAAASSQDDALARLEALRRKNEERRRQRELAKQQSSSEQFSTTSNQSIDDSARAEDAYVPQPIVLKTTEQMRALSATVQLSYKTTLVQLQRVPEIQLARMQLPVCSSEQEIMEAITDHDVVILCGETGSGKTTQVPQFLYEAGYGHPEHATCSGRIGVTQPRRVAAVSTAKRVAEELNVPFGKPAGHVGYQIRFDAEHVSDATRIKFMTDGILLKEIQQDFLLRAYSIILLDEAHERNVNTDILIGLLSRIAPLRAQMAAAEREAYELLTDQERERAPKPIHPLKLVIMSATLRVEDFTKNQRLFPKPPPVLRVDARQYPVTVHFNKRTEMTDYVDEAFKKVAKIHRKLPEGGVLVFLTGQREILQLCRQLRRAFSAKGRKAREAAKLARAEQAKQRRRLAHGEEDEEKKEEDKDGGRRRHAADRVLREHDDIEEEADLEDARVYGAEDDEEPQDYSLQSDDERERDDSEDEENADDGEEEDELAVPFMHVLPLYSLLPNDEQMRVFDEPPARHRLVVVATNVAETSLTIPGIKYVVDAGRTKERVFDLANGISSFQVQWISKASADQRAGRAGRTGPGHCYRLYSSAVYDTEFAQFSPPEILCQPIEDLVLQMKAMGIHNVLQFPFPTPPELTAIRNALETLRHLGAVGTGQDDEAITALGRVLVKFPVAARFAKMLLLAKQLGVLEYTIAIVAGLSGHTPFVNALDRRERERDQEEEDADEDEDAGDGTAKSKGGAGEIDDMEKEWREADALRRHAQWIDVDSDVLSLLRAAGAYAFSGASAQFCAENHLHEKTMQQMLKLRQQLTRIVNQLFEGDDEAFEPIELSPRMPPPDSETQVVLRQIVAAGFLDQVARRVPPGTITEGSKLERNCAYLTASGGVNEPVYIHPHSHVFTPDPAKLPPFVVYQHIQRTSRAYLKTVTAVEPSWLASVARHTPLCRHSRPLAEPSPSYNAAADEIECVVKVFYGVHKWPLPLAKVPYPQDTADESDAKDKGVDVGSRARWFAKFLLDGQVLAGLQPFAHGLREPSFALVRKRFDKKIQTLVRALEAADVSSRRALAQRWRTDPTFLREELLAWYTSETQRRVAQSWSRLVATAVQQQQQQELG
ncbi:hypothetical protein P43SY_002915 [Pythium insidiosum]|uniref:RNA helicase n=1 Tax=Pythium insidiosum TaxID=114742 RepID=A0AAD5LIN7_PYTIN|nr:hypothetical protein P43SY_002915 [Pythium insidiosum]